MRVSVGAFIAATIIIKARGAEEDYECVFFKVTSDGGVLKGVD